MQPIRRGDRGPAVAEIRSKLTTLGLLPGGRGPSDAGGVAVDAGAAVPGHADADALAFDAACDRAVRGFQQARGLSVDGVVGPETYRALDEARWQLGDRVLWFRVSHLFVGDDVADLQHRLQELGFDPDRCDGIFGRRTERAVREFQRNVGLSGDGTCGPLTLKALARLRRTVVGGRSQLIRETEELYRAGHTLAGKSIVIDPGHGGPDRGGSGHGLDEASIAEDLAARLEGRLAVLGAQAYLTRSADFDLADADRAGFANAAEADVFLSLHVDHSDSPQCSGVASYYFGSYGAGGRMTGSTVGARLASLVQREIVARTDLLDCRTHAKTWDLLRLTRMPAMRVELGYLSNPADARRLGSGDFRDTVAEAVLAGVQRLYLPPELDPPTGQLEVVGSPG